MISLQNVSKFFDTVKAVDNVSFEIKKGEIVGLLGPNGAGKTTTMRLMTGLFLPDKGTVAIDGQQPGNSIELKKKIGFLPENNPLYKDMLVSEYLNFSADLKNLRGAERKEAFDFVVKAVGIKGVFYRPIRELSKGYKQRVGMAAALLARPDVLIMDEPTEGLDPNQRTEIRALIKELGKDRTIIISTHIMSEAAAVCNRLLIISKGKLVADGTPGNLTTTSNKKSTVIVEVAGREVEKQLRQTEKLEVVELKILANGHVQAELAATKEDPVQKVISDLSHANQWTMWRLETTASQLEHVFHSLTE